MLETLDYTIRIGSTPTFLYFDLYLYSAYAAHFVYFSVGTFQVDVLAHVASRISSSPSIRHPGKFPRQLFRILVQNVSFRNRQMSLKGQKCRGTCQDGVNMSSKWRIDGVFSDTRIEEKGTSFHESRTSDQ